MMDDLDNYFIIGKITAAHGIRGDLRVFPVTDDPSRFSLLAEVTITLPRGEPAVYGVEAARLHKNMVLLKLKGVDDMNAAEKLRGGSVSIPPEQALPLGNDEYYVRDLIGVRVFAEDGEFLGEVAEVMFTGANDVYIIRKDAEEWLVPAVREYVKAVDMTEKKMTVAHSQELRAL